MVGLLKILQLKYFVYAAIYSGTVYVITNETKVTILETAMQQNVNYKNYNDSLAVAMQESYRAEVEKYPKVISIDDITEAFRKISDDNQRSFKKYADKENTKQEREIERSLANFYMLDENDSTYRVFVFRITPDSTVIYRIPVLNNDFDNLNK